MAKPTSTSKLPSKTNPQLRKIFALSKMLGFEEEVLRDVVESGTGRRSLSALSRSQAQRVIQDLEAIISQRRKNHKRLGPPSDRASVGQINYLRDLALKTLGWSELGLRSWLRRWCYVDHEKWLNTKNATKAITGLKDIHRREQEKENGTTERIQ